MHRPSTQHHRWLALALLVGTAAACRRSPKPTTACGDADVPLARATSMVAEGKLIRAVRTLESFAQMCPERASAVWPPLVTTLAELGDSRAVLRIATQLDAIPNPSDRLKQAAERARSMLAETEHAEHPKPDAELTAWALFDRCQAERAPDRRVDLCLEAWRTSHPFGLALAAAGNAAAQKGDRVAAQKLFDRARFELEAESGAPMTIELAPQDEAQRGRWITPRDMAYATDSLAEAPLSGIAEHNADWHVLHVGAFSYSNFCGRGELVGALHHDTGDLVMIPEDPATWNPSTIVVDIRETKDCAVAKQKLTLQRAPNTHSGPQLHPSPLFFPIEPSALLAQVRASDTDHMVYLELSDVRAPERLRQIPLGKGKKVSQPLTVSKRGEAFAITTTDSAGAHLVFGRTEPPWRTKTLPGPTEAYEFTPDGSKLVRTTSEGGLEVYDTGTGRRVAQTPSPGPATPEPSRCIEFSDDGRWVATTGPGQPTRWYGTTTWHLAGRTTGKCSAGCCPLRFNRGSTQIVTLLADGVSWWKLATGELVGTRPEVPVMATKSAWYATALSNDASAIAEVVAPTRTVRIHDLATGTDKIFTTPFANPTFSPDDNFLSDGHTVLDADSGRRLWTTAFMPESADIALNERGHDIVLARTDQHEGGVRIGRFASSSVVEHSLAPPLNEHSPTLIRLSRDGSRLAVLSDRDIDSLSIMQLSTGAVRRRPNPVQTSTPDVNGRPYVSEMTFDGTGRALMIVRSIGEELVSVGAYDAETLTSIGDELSMQHIPDEPIVVANDAQHVALLWAGGGEGGIDPRSPFVIYDLSDGSSRRLGPEPYDQFHDFSAVGFADNDDLIVGSIQGRVARRPLKSDDNFLWLNSETKSPVRAVAGCGQTIWAVHHDGTLQVFSPNGGHVVGRMAADDLPRQLLCSGKARVVVGRAKKRLLLWNTQEPSTAAFLAPMPGGYVVWSPSGETQVLGDANHGFVRCRLGSRILPYQVCAGSLASEDLLQRVLGTGSATRSWSTR